MSGVMEIFKRDAEQAWQYRDLCEGDIDDSERQSDESKQALAKVSELAEADRAYDRAKVHASRTFNNPDDYLAAMEALGAAAERRSAALSAVMEG